MQIKFTCKNCPYIAEEYSRKKKFYTDGHLSSEILSSCYCDKVGGKLGHCGYCSDVEICKEPDYKTSYEVSSGYKRRRRRIKNKRYKNKLRRKYENISKWYPSPILKFSWQNPEALASMDASQSMSRLKSINPILGIKIYYLILIFFELYSDPLVGIALRKEIV